MKATPVNRQPEPLIDELIWDLQGLDERDFRKVVEGLIRHLDLTVRRTNQTKHGNTEITVEKDLV